MQTDRHLNYMIEQVKKPVLERFKIENLLKLKFYYHDTYCGEQSKCTCDSLPLKRTDKRLLDRLIKEHNGLQGVREFYKQLFVEEEPDEDLQGEFDEEFIKCVKSLSGFCFQRPGSIDNPQSMRLILDQLDFDLRRLRVTIDESFVKIHNSDLKSNSMKNNPIIELNPPTVIIPTQNIITISSTAPPLIKPSSELIVDKKDNKVSKGEHELKQVLESIFPGKIFSKIRHSSIRNPETGRPLEIDCYNDELKIGGEYNGEQHVKHVTKFHKTRKGFDEQVKRDIYKEVCAKQLGITLVVINYNCDNMKGEVISQLTKTGKLPK